MKELFRLIEELLGDPARYFSNRQFYQDEIRELIEAIEDTRPPSLELLLLALQERYPTLSDDVLLLERGRQLKEQFESLLDAREPELLVELPKKEKPKKSKTDEDDDDAIEEEEDQEDDKARPNIFTLERAKLLREKRGVFEDLIELNNKLSVLIENISKLSATKDQSNPTKTTDVVADQPGAAQTMLKNRQKTHGKKIQRLE